MALGAFVAPTPAVACDNNPAVDEYTLCIPHAGGGKSPGGKPPHARPELLPPPVRAALSGPHGELLAAIATSPELGAPTTKRSFSRHSGSHHGSGSGSGPGSREGAPADVASSGRGIPAAAVDAADSAQGLALLAALAAIAGLCVFAVLRRRQDGAEKNPD